MKKLNLSLLTIALAFTFSIHANAEPMTKTQYEAANKKIESDYKSAKSACVSFSGNANDICLSEAKGNSKIAEADLKAIYEPSTKNRYKASTTKAEANYAIAKQKCDDKAGNDHDVCIKEAKATKTRAMSDAKVEMKSRKANTEANEESTDAKIEANEKSNDAKSKAMETKSDARKDANSDNRDADYAVAKEKCNVLAGDAKDQCLIKAKTRFGLN